MTRIHHADNFIGSLGFEAYRVGGSVRDEIVGKRPKDADYIVRGVTMGDLGEALVRAGADVSRIKARNFTVIGWRAAVKDIGVMEIVLPRTETNAGPGREQKIGVDPSLSLHEDAKRRDFTFNALYKGVGDGYPESAAEGGVIDPTGAGLYDLQHRLIRTTHVDSFRDDPLRTLRALRFVSTLDADLAADTAVQMAAFAPHVDGIAASGHTSGTVLSELTKLLMGQCPAKALRIARDTNVLNYVLPELEPMLGFDQGSRYHDLSTDEHTFKAIETAAKVDAPLRVRLALLFHDAGKPATAWVGADGRKHYYATRFERSVGKSYVGFRTDPDVQWHDVIETVQTEDHEIVGERLWREAAERMNADRKTTEEVATIIRHHMVPTNTKNIGARVRRMRVQFGDDLLRDLLMHRTCDLSGKGYRVALNHIQHIAKMERERQQAVDSKVPAGVKDLAINGNDLKALGIDGRQIGVVLRQVLDEVLCRPDAQTYSRDWQLKRAEALRFYSPVSK